MCVCVGGGGSVLSLQQRVKQVIVHGILEQGDQSESGSSRNLVVDVSMAFCLKM